MVPGRAGVAGVRGLGEGHVGRVADARWHSWSAPKPVPDWAWCLPRLPRRGRHRCVRTLPGAVLGGELRARWPCFPIRGRTSPAAHRPHCRRVKGACFPAGSRRRPRPCARRPRRRAGRCPPVAIRAVEGVVGLDTFPLCPSPEDASRTNSPRSRAGPCLGTAAELTGPPQVSRYPARRRSRKSGAPHTYRLAAEGADPWTKRHSR